MDVAREQPRAVTAVLRLTTSCQPSILRDLSLPRGDVSRFVTKARVVPRGGPYQRPIVCHVCPGRIWPAMDSNVRHNMVCLSSDRLTDRSTSRLSRTVPFASTPLRGRTSRSPHLREHGKCKLSAPDWTCRRAKTIPIVSRRLLARPWPPSCASLKRLSYHPDAVSHRFDHFYRPLCRTTAPRLSTFGSKKRRDFYLALQMNFPISSAPFERECRRTASPIIRICRN